jgi:hypothetical protein
VTTVSQNSPTPRIVCRFSCGAASAVATKLVLSEGQANVVILNAFIVEEHPDNRRFLADCEKWFDHPVTVLRDEKYGASVRQVWRKKRFMSNGLIGALCSVHLKHELLDAACLDGDIHVLGFTAEESKRFERFASKRPPGFSRAPLVEKNLTKADCLAMVERAGIRLPEMYRLGFNNANCIGCCKGGEGYWNHVRRTFPEVFAEVAQIEKEIGVNAYMFRNRQTGERYGLEALNPEAGRHDVSLPDCSLFCAMAEEEIQ